ncbi:MAG: energy transducer TonB [Bacteroidaceae bacterium]|nr:energy transducer TonB [Bacteroidaceae bacterium]
MKRNVLILLVSFVMSMAMNVVAQEREQLPQFPGGDTELMNFVAQNLVYPEQAIKDKVQGRVIVEMVIETTGEVVDAKILRSVSPECDAEVLRIVRLMPKWTPGYKDGEPVRTTFVLPVIFKLSRNKDS